MNRLALNVIRQFSQKLTEGQCQWSSDGQQHTSCAILCQYLGATRCVASMRVARWKTLSGSIVLTSVHIAVYVTDLTHWRASAEVTTAWAKWKKKPKKQETKERRREHSSALMSSRRRQGEKQKQRQKELGKWEDVGSLASHIQFDRSNHTGRGVIQVSESMRRLCHAVFTPLFSWSCIPL